MEYLESREWASKKQLFFPSADRLSRQIDQNHELIKKSKSELDL